MTIPATDNAHVVEQLLTAFTDADLESAERALSPEFVNHDPPALPGVGSDRAGVLTAIQYFHSTFTDARAELVCVVAQGDKVAVHDRLCGTHTGEFLGIAPTGREVRVDFIHLFRVVDGQIVERWGIADTATLLQQLGGG